MLHLGNFHSIPRDGANVLPVVELMLGLKIIQLYLCSIFTKRSSSGTSKIVIMESDAWEYAELYDAFEHQLSKPVSNQ